MKRLTLLLLLGQIKAIKLNQRFIEDIPDEDADLLNDDDDTPPATSKVATKTEVHQRSDPIFGSNGIDERLKTPIVTDEQKLEADLASRKPI